MIIPGIFQVRTKNSERLMQEHDTSRNDASDIIIHCLYGLCTEARKMNDSRGKTMHRGMMDKDFIVFKCNMPGRFLFTFPIFFSN
jgi:hypothetical protein